MPIICQLCQQSFDKFISGKHLKYKHNITGIQYKQQFGEDSLCTTEFREERRSGSTGVNKGRTPHNKGKKVTDPDQLNRIRSAIEQREQRYKESGHHPRLGAVLDQTTKDKISKSVIQYAQNNPHLMQQRAAKAQKTLRQQGFDFGTRMRGKHHSDQTKKKLRELSRIAGETKSENSLVKLQEAVARANLTFDRMEGSRVFVKCNSCNNQFGITRQYFTDSKWRIDICPLCRPDKIKSNAELDILTYVRDIMPDIQVVSGDRHTIFPLELDIVIPSKNIAIEYCGLYWHSELRGKNKDYHKNKMQLCAQQGIRLITIFEDEWISSPQLVKSRLAAILGVESNKIMARKCTIKSISNQLAREFCAANHVQGSGNGSHSLGLYHQDQLVAVATFSRPSVSKGAKNSADNVWELNRMCNLQGHIVVGGASKLFREFCKQQHPLSVITYCDLRWNTGNVYAQMGFTKVHDGVANYWYIQPPVLKRIHRFALRKTIKDDQTLTEWENRKQQGWDRIWDCGSSKWIWNREKE